LKQVSVNYAEMNERQLAQRISVPGVVVQIPVLKESIHDAQSAPSSVVIYVSIIKLTKNSFPTFALKSPKRIVDSLVLTLRKTSKPCLLITDVAPIQ